MIVILRGPSGSGKTTIARNLQSRLEEPTAVLQQDHFRRIVYREKLGAGLEHMALMAAAAEHAIGRGHHVILEGDLAAARYARDVERIGQLSDDARYFAFDLTFAETLVRHAGRPQAAEFGEAEMRTWYRGWDPLPFVNENRIGADEDRDAIVERILTTR